MDTGTKKKNAERKRMVKKMKFPMRAEVPSIKSMVHVSSHCLLVAYCDDMRLRLLRDHHQAFVTLGTSALSFLHQLPLL